MAKAKTAKRQLPGQSAAARLDVPRRSAAAKTDDAARKKARRIDRRRQAVGAGSTSLVIVESPTKAKTIGKYLGRAYHVQATIGHVRDLPEKKLGVDVENGFEPKYVTIKGKEKTLAELKSRRARSSEIFLATDPDREGEAIAWHVAEQIKSKNGAPVSRVLFHEITKDAVQLAIANAGKIDERKVEAQQARRILDRLVGYKASPVLWKTIKTGLSAGRVQTVALRLLVEREREIRAFKPEEYWTIEALLEKDKQQFTAKLHQVDGKKPAFSNEAAGERDPRRRSSRACRSTSPRSSAASAGRIPRAPFTTSTLQQEAAKKLGFGSKRTMRLAQDLYEGIEIGDEGRGRSHHLHADRLDARAPTARGPARDFIRTMYGKEYLPDAPRLYVRRQSARTRRTRTRRSVRPIRRAAPSTFGSI